MLKKSKFDNGDWGRNNLPSIPCIVAYLESLLKEMPDLVWTDAELNEAVIEEFGIPAADVARLGDSTTPLFKTRMNYILADAIQGEREDHIPDAPIVGEPWAKRVASGQYQHVSGNGVAVPVRKRAVKPALPVRTPVDDAADLIKHALKIGINIAEIRSMISDRFDTVTLNNAVAKVSVTV